MVKMDPELKRLASKVAVAAGGRAAVATLLLTLTILGAGASYGYFRFGSLLVALAAIRGESLVVDEAVKTVSGIRPGARVSLQYVLRNISRRPIKLLGSNPSCSCSVVQELPMTIGVSEAKSVTALISTHEDQTAFDGTIRLYTNDPRSAEFVLGYMLHFEPSDHRNRR